MYYLQFWSAFANEWSARTRGETDSKTQAPVPVSEAPHTEQPAYASLEPDVWPELWTELYSHTLVDDIALAQQASRIIEEIANAPTSIDHKKYAYFTQYGSQILCLFTPRDGCTYLSANFETLTGQKIDTQYGKGFFESVHSDYHGKLRDAVIAAAAKPQSLRCKFQHGDGKYYWYQFTLHKEAAEYVCIAENIHEHMQTQQTLQKAKLEAELALRARSEFLANMSHDLRTPLNAVIGFSQMIENGTFGKINVPQYVDYVRHINESGYDLLAKIEDLLEIANIDAGRVSLDRDEIHLSSLIKQVLDSQRHHAEACGVTLAYHPKGDVLLFVDRLKLQHILGHLVSNAIKFSPHAGTVVIEVARAQNGLRLSIRDNGMGMSSLQCHDIREALAQENCWTAKNSHSIGIGLALTKEFIALHGGDIAIESQVGVGTTIAITLPRDCIRITPTQLRTPTPSRKARKQLAHS